MSIKNTKRKLTSLSSLKVAQMEEENKSPGKYFDQIQCFEYMISYVGC